MKENHYNPSGHPGELPVRVLQHNVIDWLEKLSPNLFGIMKDEVAYNNLKAGISYNISKTPIQDIAHITQDRKIETFENFNAYLWCMSYVLFVLFDESIQKPMLAGTYNGQVDRPNPHIDKALKLFDYAMSLKSKYTPWPDDLPNPEKYGREDKYYVEKTNGIFISAMVVILAHEIAHQYYGHLDYLPTTKEEYVNDEHNADFFAIDYVNENRSKPIYPSLKAGAVVCFCSLMLLDGSLDGGPQHPNQDIRIKSIMERLDLVELDNMWGVASLAFRLWSFRYGKEYDLPKAIENYKTLFYLTLAEVGTN